MVTSRVFLKKSVLQWATLVHGGGTSTGYAANALRGLFLLERVSQSFTSTKSKSKRYGFPFIWLVDVIRPVNWIQQNKITLPHLKFFTTLELTFCLISLKSRVGYQKKKKEKIKGLEANQVGGRLGLQECLRSRLLSMVTGIVLLYSPWPSELDTPSKMEFRAPTLPGKKWDRGKTRVWK